MGRLLRLPALVPLALLGACATLPTGPGVMAMPGTGKSFDQFRVDDADCRQFALSQLGGTTPNQAATDSAVASAVVGTALGAAVGAAFGGHQGAGVGAGTGLLVGGLAGTGAAQASAGATQRRYDASYAQCMYAKGERVPVSGQMLAPLQTPSPLPGPSYGAIPPPPPGSPPPPPPGAIPPPPGYAPPASFQPG